MLTLASLALPAQAQSPAPVPAAIQSSEATATFAIAAGPLDQALILFGQQTGVGVSVDSALTEGLRSSSLQGTHPIPGALDRLLAGTGLYAVRDATGSYLVRRQPQQNAAGDGTSNALPEVVITAAPWSESTEGSASYAPLVVSAGNKTGASLRQIPRSVSVVTRQQLDDQRMTAVDDVMEQLSGVTLAPSTVGYMASSYYARGFQITSMLVDGSPASAWSNYDSTSNTGLAKFDSVQLVRGPDALFSGSGQPSGSINMVRKKAQEQFRLRYAASAGSWKNYQGEVDVTGKLIDSGHVRGRVVAAYNDREYFFNGANRQISTLYATLAADLGAATVLNMGLSQDRNDGSGREGAPHLPRYSTGEPLPISRNLGYTDWSFTDSTARNYFATLEHDFNADWSGRVNLSRTSSSLVTNVSSYNGAVNPVTGAGSYLFQGTWAEGEHATTAVDAYLRGHFNLLGRRHQLVVGADRRNAKTVTDLYYSTAGQADVDWSDVNPNTLLPINSRGSFDGTMAAKTQEEGVYANARFQLTDSVSAVLGGRYSRLDIKRPGGSSWDSNASAYITTNHDNHFLPYYALLYDFAPQWTAYFSAAESFEDQSTNYTEDGRTLDPTTGRSFELGIKGEHFGGALNSNLTLYRATRDNLAVRVSRPTDFDVPGRSCCFSGDGKLLSQGVELELSGQIARGWQVNAGYTFDDNETAYGTADGERYASYTPEHTLKFFARYEFPGAASGWTLGGGARIQSGYFKSGTVATWNPTGGPNGTGDFDGPSVPYRFQEPGRSVWDLFVEKRLNTRMSLALNVNNVFDKRYFRAVGNTASGNIYGAPRSFMLTLRGEFD